ncbi:hypothetical protein DSCW_48420 [Desulfosarcina widdelii]|uniref:Uncharacterized protein n=2 Tax=Desulfosarcina widdelii TaxID=947919 RepID=A0A5K7Z9P0_9BACT|nr:hypothetical protein DSCW_48420 [Desulfosarcina widdelii]
MGTGTGSGLVSGTFLDSAVEGLHYQTATQSGFTDMNGTFFYNQGETIRFFMGDVMLGEAPADQYMTPVDLVPDAIDEMHPMVTNMSRLLQTADEDGDPSNGIFIPAAVDQAMMGSSLSFDMPIEDFANHADVVMFMDALDTIGGGYAGRTMTAAEDAQAHMRSTLADMMRMMGGRRSVNTGVFLDSAVEGLSYETATQSGVTDMDGTFSYMDGEYVRFYMADVLLGEAPAESFMTPLNLVPGALDETHPTVTNISRFLQTMDIDADPSNGIFIPGTVITEMQGRHIDFNMSPDAFGIDAEVSMLMDTLGAMDPAYAGRMMVSTDAAQTHMGNTLDGMPGDNGDTMNSGNAGNGMPGGNGNVSNGGGMMNGGNFSNEGSMM